MPSKSVAANWLERSVCDAESTGSIFNQSINQPINQYRLINRRNRLKVPADTAAAGTRPRHLLCWELEQVLSAQ